MRIAQPTDWQTTALPADRTTIRLDRLFSPEQMKRIRLGLVPEEMEDKWFIYWQDDTLFFHRSWTGFCIYVVHFQRQGDTFRMIQAEANRGPQPYGETSDAKDAAMISYLIDVLLLRQDASFPSEEPSDSKKALMEWSWVGRAMFGQHPQRKRSK